MRQKILKQVGVLLTVSILLTFLVVSLTMYSKFNGYILVNGKKVDIPSYRCDVSDEISLSRKGKKVELFKENFNTNFPVSYPYLSKNEDFKGKLVSLPNREDIPIEIEDQLIVEYYSKNM